MFREILCVLIIGGGCLSCWAGEPLPALPAVVIGQAGAQSAATTKADDETTALRERLKAYIDTFNQHAAEELAGYWAVDGVSIAEETGQRTVGREALQSEFAAFFAESPGVRLTGEVTEIRMIRPEVAQVEGRTVLFVADSDPVESMFSAVLVKEQDQWLISSSHEHNLPEPATPYDALSELEWLLGTWEDQSEAAQVTTTVRWSPNRAFLLRSFQAQIGEAAQEGTQVIGWDPLSKQIRTWTFSSDGSFGQGTVSKHDDDWMLKMWEILSDGRLAAATKVMTRVDENTITVQTIGATVDGEPAPASEPVTVIRTATAAGLSQSDESTETQGGTR